MKEYRVSYPDIWFMVDYSHEEEEPTCLYLKAWKIEGLDEENPDNSDLDDIPHVEGAIKWDGCANLTFDPCVHFCGLYMVYQHTSLLMELYKEAQKLFPDGDMS